MKRSSQLVSVGVALISLLAAGVASAQVAVSSGRVVIPRSSIARPGDAGVRMHTNYQIFVPAGLGTGAVGALGVPAAQPNFYEPQPMGLPPFSGYLFETPASLGCIYKLVSPLGAGCNPNVVTANPTGGSRAIGIVDAFDYPNALSDLKKFSTQFGLAAPSLTVVYASGSKPPVDPTGNWEIEEALDLEWAHAFAPNAKLILVEAASNSNANLLIAEDKASSLVAAAGGGEVSNSWGGSEFSGETSNDSHFKKATVVYFAAAGDNPGVLYPSASPFVVSAGGTATSRNATTGAFQTEVAWYSTGGGVSALEPRPSYQSGVSAIVGSKRGTPDFSFDSDPATGVWVYASVPGNPPSWYIVGGTSLASPALAAIVNSAGHFAASSNAELTTIYANRAVASDFRDITNGYCGPFYGLLAVMGYDLCTGVGTDQGKVGK